MSAWEIDQKKTVVINRRLANEEIQALNASIRDESRLPDPLKRSRSVLRLSPSLGRFYMLPAVHIKLGSLELNALATHWAKTFMGSKQSLWQWQAVQSCTSDPILLCACKVDIEYRQAFKTVTPEVIHILSTLAHHDSAWVICRDDLLIQSALVLKGKVASAHAWPAMYSGGFVDVIEKHLLLSDQLLKAEVPQVIDSRYGEVETHVWRPH
ncbi:hypothetical protein NQT62_04085 [Limnobacter humi]|uniref:Uncharacterized protein n=1 Tax=Limnobacter humi TaxID=1778671 RepID=A0ABT1WDL9_9BURK|nr:hypothetical protein [Limnobacter humi]MCQ8895621.1 hypothetical protein [Limnobacter humi]